MSKSDKDEPGILTSLERLANLFLDAKNEAEQELARMRREEPDKLRQMMASNPILFRGYQRILAREEELLNSEKRIEQGRVEIAHQQVELTRRIQEKVKLLERPQRRSEAELRAEKMQLAEEMMAGVRNYEKQLRQDGVGEEDIPYKVDEYKRLIGWEKIFK